MSEPTALQQITSVASASLQFQKQLDKAKENGIELNETDQLIDVLTKAFLTVYHDYVIPKHK